MEQDGALRAQRDPDTTVAIDMCGVSKRRGGSEVLHSLWLRVTPGEIYGLIGPSGSGKSTTLQLICGHLWPSAGDLRVLGEVPAHFSRGTRRRIGYMPQHFALYQDLTVTQNVAFAAGLYGLAEWRLGAQIREVLELLEIWDARHSPARAISGGMQRRLALAAALIHNPDLLVADEPTANLDPILRARLWGHFHERGETGRTMLITTQYIDEAEYCDRVGLLFQGSLIAEGRPATLRRRAFGGDIVDIVLARPAQSLAAMLNGVTGVHGSELLPDGTLRVVMADAEQTLPRLMIALSAVGASVQAVRHYRPTFDEVFIRLIEQHGRAHLPAAPVPERGEP